MRVSTTTASDHMAKSMTWQLLNKNPEKDKKQSGAFIKRLKMAEWTEQTVVAMIIFENGFDGSAHAK